MYIAGALQRAIKYYLCNFLAFSSSVCGDRCNENLITFSLAKLNFCSWPNVMEFKFINLK